MDFYSTFFCLPSSVHHQQQRANGTNTTTTKIDHQLNSNALHQPNNNNSPSSIIINSNSKLNHPIPTNSSPANSEHSFFSPSPSTSDPINSLPLVSRIPSQITNHNHNHHHYHHDLSTNNQPNLITTTVNAYDHHHNNPTTTTTSTTTPPLQQVIQDSSSSLLSQKGSQPSSSLPSSTIQSASPGSSVHRRSCSNASSPICQNAPLPPPEIVQRTCAELMSDYHCLVHATHAVASSTYGFHLSGSFPQVMAARGRLLRDQPFEVERIVAVDRNDVLENGANVRPVMKIRLDEIASTSHAHLSIVGNPRDGGGIDIVIRGALEAVEEARVRLLVLLDQLNGLHSEICEIDYKLHHIIAGRKRSVIQSIQEETATHIYFPSVLSGGGILSTRSPSLPSKQNLIFITGEFFGVQRAREMLFQVSIHKSKCIISRDTAMLPRKLDWLLMEKFSQLQQIMYDNGTFINLPPIGSQTSVISVYGDHRVHIERSIRSLMQLACEFYIANVWLIPKSIQDVYKNGPQSTPVINQTEIQSDGQRISIESGAEVVFKSTNSFEVYGTEKVAKRAVEKILELDMVRNCQVEIRFQVELACEHRDFISGKKNGKLNKIMKSSNVKIKFESFNDYNFLLNLSGNSLNVMMGLTLLEEELPAEISFHIPECYHKRIIGVGGKNIQRIMKKYGVYVKFSNAKEFAKLGGYQNNHDNVVARTPAKNAENLENLKQSVMELVHPKDKDFTIEPLYIDRTQHRTILGEKSIFIHDIESKTNTCFYYPSSESGSSKIEIFGPRSQIAIAKQMIMSHIGLELDCQFLATSELVKLVSSEEFEEKVIKTCKNLWNVNVSVIGGGVEGEELTIKFGLNRAHSENLKHARETLETLLIEKKIHYPRDRTAFTPYHRRGTVNSMGSTDRSTNSFSTFTPTTPTDPTGFGTINHRSSEKDLQGLNERSSHRQPFPSLSSSTNSSSSYVYHPSMSMNRLYNQFAGIEANMTGIHHRPTAIGTPGAAEWTSIPRQITKNNNYNNSSNNLAVGGNLSNSPIGNPLIGSSVLSSLDNTYPSFINRKSAISPRAQSLDLGRPAYGSQLMKDYAQGLFNNAASPSSGPDETLTHGSSSNTSILGHRHRFSQGGLNHHSGFISGFGGLNLGL